MDSGPSSDPWRRYAGIPVTDPIERPTPPERPPRRPRRFVLPVDHHDSRTSERIEAFLEGPARAARRRRGDARRPRRPILLSTASEWQDALRREEARAVRYGRPATVMVVDVAVRSSSDGPAPTSADFVEPVLEAIRHEARETDHVMRSLPTRFHLLLPETAEREAHHLAERLRAACRERLNGLGEALDLRVESVTPGHGASLADAIRATERRLAG
jgi:GGDEF domain-containing protein